MEKMGIWKYSPDQMDPKIHANLFAKIKVRWENTVQTIKDIFEQQLRQLVPNLIGAEVKKAMKEHEGRMLLKFNSCLILMKNIESTVRSANDIWKAIYHLNKPLMKLWKLRMIIVTMMMKMIFLWS